MLTIFTKHTSPLLHDVSINDEHHVKVGGCVLLFLFSKPWATFVEFALSPAVSTTGK